MSDFVAIPTAVIYEPAYKKLPAGPKEFLIALYVEHGACGTFSVQRNEPERYGQKPGSSITYKLQRLVDAGLVQLVDKRKIPSGKYVQRIFAFKHSAAHAYE